MPKPIRKKPKKKAAKKPVKRKTVKKPKSKNAPGMHDAREIVAERRYETRELVSKMTFAAISFNTQAAAHPEGIFTPDLSGLLIDLSAGGCSLVFMKSNPLSGKIVREAKCLIQLSPGLARAASIRWIKELDGKLVNAGFAFAS